MSCCHGYQLAADAGESVAMTDDEKKRIGDLLADLETVPEVVGEEDLQLLVSREILIEKLKFVGEEFPG